MITRLGLLLVPIAATGLIAGCGSSGSDAEGEQSATQDSAQGSAQPTQPGESASAPAATASADEDTSEGEATSGDCGVGEVDGVQTRTFCGDGTATISTGSVNLTLDSADCTTDSMGFAVNAGTIVLDPDDSTVTAATQYIGFAILAEGNTADGSFPDGTYDGIVAGNDRGTDLTSSPSGSTITLTDGGKAGTVTGTTFEGEPITGSFSCS
jgi:hypothetical protein